MVDYNAEPLVQVKDLCKYFQVGRHATLKAVDGVSFNIYKGETVGLVGESGCGKSTAGRCLIRLYEPTSGQVIFDGKDVTKLNRHEQKEFCHRVQMIFQNPYASLNPRMTVKEIVGEGLKLQGKSNSEIEARVEELLKTVGLNKDHMSRFPHEFSGGQRQRIGIARALSVDPEFIICDEPISALDVSIQAQVINMFEDLQEQMGLTYLFIAHDLSVVKHISDRIVVMYLGRMVELADSYELTMHSMHPYTRSLVSAIPIADPVQARKSKRIILEGDVPSPIDPPSGCRFRTRCPYADERCAAEVPEFKEVTSGHYVACHHLDKVK